jgi:outer membrane protein assembly factor BamB
MKKTYFIVFIQLFFISLALGTVYTVDDDGSADFSSIQDAINVCVNGDIVVVMPGIYNPIYFKGKNITITSQDPNKPKETVINGNGSSRVVTFSGIEDQNCVLNGFTITGGNSGGDSGGGIYGHYASPTIINCRIIGNITSRNRYGGGISSCYGPIIKCEINENVGGGIWSSYGLIQGCTIKGNTSMVGGGLSSCYGFIQGCVISDNTAIQYGGGLSQCGATIQGCVITRNTGDQGGGLYQCNGSIIDCKISGNNATTGGGLYQCNGSIIDCKISENNASTGGGLYNCNGTITNCRILRNKASNLGGGFSYPYYQEGTGNFINCIIAENQAADWAGGAYFAGTMTNCTIANNISTTTNQGGVGSIGGSQVSFKNSIVWNNRPVNFGYDCSICEYCCVEDFQCGIEGEPGLFTFEGLYTLRPDSPCIDAGNNDFLPAGILTDIYGNPRFYDEPLVDDTGFGTPPIVDVGACEYRQLTDPHMLISEDLFQIICPKNGSFIEERILRMVNSGGGIFNWTVIEDCDWVEVYPSSGSCVSGEQVEIVLQVNAESLERGNYECEFMITGEGADNSPRYVKIELFVSGCLYVPYEYSTIQDAIDASTEGESVVVYPGTYQGQGNRDIDFKGKVIAVRSTDPNNQAIVESTVIDCEGQGRGFYFHSNEEPNSVLSGFSIINGFADYGGGICCSYSSPKIERCIIRDCQANGNGGGIHCDTSNPKIEFCTISNNICQDSGGGIIYSGCKSSRTVISNCVIKDNFAGYQFGGGGGLYSYDSDLDVRNCIICRNRSEGEGGGIFSKVRFINISNSLVVCNTAEKDGAGIYIDGGSIIGCTISENKSSKDVGGLYRYYVNDGYIINCIIWGNISSGPGVTLSQTNCSDLKCCCIQDQDPCDVSVPFGLSNIDDDPLFVREPNDGGDGFGDDPATPGVDEGANDDLGDLHLQKNSPCINAGTPGYFWPADITDMDGQPRVIGARVDMGADEYAPMIVVNKPQGGEVWSGGSSHSLEWISFDVEGNIDIQLSTNRGVDWDILAGDLENNGSYLWSLPEIVDSNKCIIQVVPNVLDASVICIPSGLFTIKPYNPDTEVESLWETLGKNYQRRGLSDFDGPELGCVKWVFDTDGPVTSSAAVGDSGQVYAACEDGNLYAIDASGILLWKYDANTPLKSSPSIGPDGTVYVGGENGILYAVDRDGELRWTHSTGGCIYSSPAVDSNGRIFAGSMDGKLYALRSDGSELWTFETVGYGSKTSGSIMASPAIDVNGVVYITGLYDPNLYALDANYGSVKWKSLVKNYDPNSSDLQGSSVSPVIGPDGTVYTFFSGDPNLYAVEPNEGIVKWNVNLADPCSPWFGVEFSEKIRIVYSGQPPLWLQGKWYLSSCFSEPVIGPDGTIYVSFEDPFLRAVDPNGCIKWVTRLGMVGGFTMATGANGLIYAAGDDGYLCVVDSNGVELSRFVSKDNILSRPVIAEDNTLIVSDANNKIWAISANGCPEDRQELHRPVDIFGDGIVNFYDIALFARNWLGCTDRYFGPAVDGRFSYKVGGRTIYHCNYTGDEIYFDGDLNRDLDVDAEDFNDVTNQWLGREYRGKAPQVTITNPEPGELFLSTSIVDIRADAFDSDGQIEVVAFFANDEFIGSDSDGTDGWEIQWTSYSFEEPWIYCYLKARALDNDGMAGSSDEITIILYNLPPPG